MVDEPHHVRSWRAGAEPVPDPFAFLAEASTILASSLDYETTLASVARLAVPILGDCCIVEVVDETSTIRRVAAVHVDPSKESLVLGVLDLHPSHGPASTGRPTTLSGGQAFVVPEISEPLLEAFFGADEHRLRVVRELGPRSLMLVPLVARNRALGTIGLAVTESDRRYGPEDRHLAESLARRAALAVDNALLYQAESRARAVAEVERRRAEQLAAEAQRLARERGDHLARLNVLLRVSQEVLEQTTVKGLLQHVADAARELTRARMAVAGHSRLDGVFEVGATSGDGAETVCPLGDAFVTENGGVHLELVRDKVSSRYTDEELRSHRDWWGLPAGHLPVRGLLGARLGGIDGFSPGLILASDREQGDFTVEDEALLRQLAALASLGLKHIEARTQAEEHAGELDAIFTSMSDIVLVYGPSRHGDEGEPRRGLGVRLRPGRDVLAGARREAVDDLCQAAPHRGVRPPGVPCPRRTDDYPGALRVRRRRRAHSDGPGLGFAPPVARCGLRSGCRLARRHRAGESAARGERSPASLPGSSG